MTLAYFRKSNYSVEETIANLKKELKTTKWVIVGETKLPDMKGSMLLISYGDLLKEILHVNYQLVGLLPVSLFIFEKNNEVHIGTGTPTLLKAVGGSEKITKLALHLEEALKKLIHAAAGVDDLKPNKVKLYSTMTCPYCKMEKAWLDEKKVEHEVVYVDHNQKEAEYMVAQTGQMGVPVTEVQYDGAESEFIIGFDKNRLSSLLGVQG